MGNEELNTKNITSIADEMIRMRNRIEELEKKYLDVNNTLGTMMAQNAQVTQMVNMMKAMSMGTGPTVR